MNKTIFMFGLGTFIVFTLLSNIIICLEIGIGIVLPGIKTITALKEMNAIKDKRIRLKNRNEITTHLEELLCYWIIFSTLTAIHIFCKMILPNTIYFTYAKLIIFFLLQFPLFELRSGQRYYGYGLIYQMYVVPRLDSDLSKWLGILSQIDTYVLQGFNWLKTIIMY